MGFFLSGFDYKIEFIKGVDNLVADSLSRLVSETNDNVQKHENSDVVNWVEKHLPIDFSQIKTKTMRDLILQKVITYVIGSWPQVVTNAIKPFYNRKLELHVEGKVLFWGYRTVIPTKFTKLLLTELHSTHLGIVKMKSLARSYFWWQNIDIDIESTANNCNICIMHKPEPQKIALTK